jgi:hypothetical protein
MAGATRYLLNRNGRFFARLVIPKDLRCHLQNRTELRKALGSDRRVALRQLPGAVAGLQHAIALAEREAATSGNRISNGRYPLSDQQLASKNYAERLTFDELLRATDDRFASIGIDDQLVLKLRDGIAGRLDDDELEALVGHTMARYRQLGHFDTAKGEAGWRSLSRALCISEYEALARSSERDDGDFSGQPSHPLLADLPTEPEPLLPVPLMQLYEEYFRAQAIIGVGREAERRWKSSFTHLIKFVGHDDATRLTKQKEVVPEI